ncbi:MAG: polyprenyl diphosphate synthase, partial [Sphingomonadaceae bacterium]
GAGGRRAAAGHRAGAEAARRTIRAAGEAGVECLTLYAFSSENWRRPESEVNDLMGLLRHYVRTELEEIHKEGARLKLLGDLSAFPADIQRLVGKAVERTRDNRRITIAVALNYGARGELVRACRALAGRAVDGKLDPTAIDEAMIDRSLQTSGLPPLDLLIRTSGEKRLSNFLLWQAAYAEMLFVDTLWPDFDAAAFRAALADYGARHRRYGGL